MLLKLGGGGVLGGGGLKPYTFSYVPNWYIGEGVRLKSPTNAGFLCISITAQRHRQDFAKGRGGRADARCKMPTPLRSGVSELS